jgi:hypothetical protein
MRKYARVLVRGALGLTAAMVMAGAAQASAALFPYWQRSAEIMVTTKVKRDWTRSGPAAKGEGIRPLVLAQKNEPVPEKPKSPPAPATETRKMKRAAPPATQMERSKSIKPDEDLERAGTKKLGGEVIRNKEE